MKLFSVFTKIAPICICMIWTGQALSAGSLSGDISIATSNLPSEISQKFSLKKISDDLDLNKLPEEFRKLVMATNEYDYYFAISPTKKFGGYIFETHKAKKVYTICLRAPKPMSAVTMAVTTPIALITVRKGAELNPMIVECK